MPRRGKFYPWTPLGALPQTPVIGSRSALTIGFSLLNFRLNAGYVLITKYNVCHHFTEAVHLTARRQNMRYPFLTVQNYSNECKTVQLIIIKSKLPRTFMQIGLCLEKANSQQAYSNTTVIPEVTGFL